MLGTGDTEDTQEAEKGPGNSAVMQEQGNGSWATAVTSVQVLQAGFVGLR